jgi:membrane fusion protein, heavy metal efflux system
MTKYIFFILIACVACKQNKTETAISATEQTAELQQNTVQLTNAQLKNIVIEMQVLQPQNIPQTLKANGMVDVPPQNLYSVSFPLGGYLKSTQMLPGYNVKKGMVIAILEDQAYVDLQQNYLTAKAKIEYLQADVQRQKELSDADAARKKNYQLVLSDYKTQLILIKALEEKLKIVGINPATLTINSITNKVEIKSPINGYVTKVNVNIGKYVNPTDVLFELVNPDDIHAAIDIFEKDLPLIKKGMKGKVMLADKPHEYHDVEVILATQNVDENRTGLIHCHFEKEEHGLLPGMFLTAELYISNSTQLAITNEAVCRFEGNTYVFVQAANNSYSLEAVKEIATYKNYTAIEFNNKLINTATAKIVTKGAYALLGMLKNKAEEE